MPFPVAAAIGFGASALGGYLSGRGQATANRQTRALVREQMAFQERMSGTSYQRAVKDMRLAGINPLLAYQQGGASTPGGASAEMKSTLGPAVSSAIAVRRMGAEIEAIQAGILKTRAETEAIRGRPGRILEPAVDAGVELSRRLFGNTSGRIMPPGYPDLSELISNSVAGVQRLTRETVSRIRRAVERFIPSLGPNTTRRR